ncbi:hypothetical protein DFH07DRAFT_856748 [Mycena maculata]|uniref:PARP catalytic domain-containing protein n=1 Tax=Mycena maculata TaxID=230809 RepID=A0AAD7HLH4_9AGAR|nr:hypothetical protein DFH07DRAFT_856748 [Mycena maculata]
MASVIWVDSDTDDVDVVEFVEAPTPRKHTRPLAGPSKIFNAPATSAGTPHKKRQHALSSDSEIEIVEKTPRAPKKKLKSKPRPPLKERSFDDEVDESDHAVALALQKKWEEEDALAQKRAAETDEKSRRLIERLQKMDEKMAQKRRKLAKGREVPEDGIVYHVVIDADGNTIEGEDDPDNAARLELVKSDFDQALRSGLKLKNVHWFVNAKLEARFEAAKELLNSLGVDTTERNLFHGTAEKNIQPILEGGFLIPGVSQGIQMVHGAACGKGIYLGMDPNISFGYCQGATKMFMCRVITGRSTQTISQAIPRPLGNDQFESWSGPGVYVVKYVDLVVPRYVVEFEMNGALQNFGGLYGGLAGLGGLAGPAGVPGGGLAGLGAFPLVAALPVVRRMMMLIPPAVPVAPPIPAFNPVVGLAAPAARVKPQSNRALKIEADVKIEGKGKAKQVDDPGAYV